MSPLPHNPFAAHDGPAPDEVEPDEVDELDAEIDAVLDDEPTADNLAAGNTKDELLGLAEAAGIDVPASANKATIAEAIVDARGDGD